MKPLTERLKDWWGKTLLDDDDLLEAKRRVDALDIRVQVLTSTREKVHADHHRPRGC
jgi:hypothetical protein